ncbi:MAG: hypothetical protein Q4G14_10355 [Paracoccus sp. (in: a-proteobacteria)]|uniref:hypothetical protein n=1 Tax=Paracoccus sp. TaxID=267 RepID=UPI0026E03932|nr:hypothetical protein [Paracoccus sp. (in: a-proteobacteria)]MDO5613625.1 hypothetical protein [Paracoccus sp. (in: a-proteobacteria)]
MTLIRNERTKLTATFINGLAIAIFAVGGLAPLFSAAYGTSNAGWRLAVGSLACFAGSAALHLLARRILKGLEG